jgi:hypothetical protein
MVLYAHVLVSVCAAGGARGKPSRAFNSRTLIMGVLLAVVMFAVGFVLMRHLAARAPVQ